MFRKKWEVFDTLEEKVDEMFRRRKNAQIYADTMNHFEQQEYDLAHDDYKAVIGPPGEVYIVRRKVA